MSKYINGDRLFAIAILILTLAFMAVASGLNPTAGRMPLVVSIFTLLCLAAYFIAELRQGLVPVKKKKKHDDEPRLEWSNPRVWIWPFLLVILTYLLGMIVGLATMTVVFFRFAANGTWRGSLLFGAVGALFLYVVFVVGFQESVFPGILAELLLGA